MSNFGFKCSCDDEARSACSGLPLYRAHEGRQYCILHFPGGKGDAFDDAIKNKRTNKDFDFSGVWFPRDVDFFGFQFDTDASFSKAIFKGTANFSEAEFKGAAAVFTEAAFEHDANFSNCEFKGQVSFSSATFGNKALFNAAEFGDEVLFTFVIFQGEIDFEGASIAGLVSFDFAEFHDYVRFALRKGEERRQGFGKNSSLSIQAPRIDHPEQVSFHTLELRAHWFINVDVRRFDFIDVEWLGLRNVIWRSVIKREIKALEDGGLRSPHRLLSITCRQLAVNAEENHRYREASMFRYWAMDVRRREKARGSAFWTLDWWYWLASGYGESVARAFLALILIWLLFAAAYAFVGFARMNIKSSKSDESHVSREVTSQPVFSLTSSLAYSAEVMTFQKPEPRPATVWARAWVVLETILGPLQAALLALAIRRKFTR